LAASGIGRWDIAMHPGDKVLVIDDEPFSREYFRRLLQPAKLKVDTAATAEEGLNILEHGSYDLVILDLRLPDADGICVLKRIRECAVHTPVIIITAYGTVGIAVEAMKLGAFDFLSKPFEDQEKLLLTIRNAIHQGKLQRENISLRKQVRREALFPEIIGQTPAMKRVLELARRAAEVESTVLIQGESGTGKELVARAIHAASPRNRGPFLALDCAALPESLLESTLFGYEKGSFTGAVKTTKGYFEEAHQGTLFLDEIGDASLPLQARLLRAIQEKSVVRVGGTQAHYVDVRLITATNKDLRQEVVARRFRKDLFYRINVISIEIPPLRERKEDIPLLATNFIYRFCRDTKQKPKRLDASAIQALLNHDWPGNVRELQNLMERVVALVPGELVTGKDIVENMTFLRTDMEGALFERPLQEARYMFEKEYFRFVLKKFGGNVRKAAVHASIHPATFYRRLKEYTRES
jgi:DNA-binding NtrC family response regulator